MWWLFAIATAGHVAAVLLVHLFSGGEPLFPDAMGYDARSSHIRDLWADGVWLSARDLASIVGSEIWGYPALMAAAKLLTNGTWLTAKVVLSVLSASAAPAAYLLADSAEIRRSRAVLSGLAVGLSPNLLFWDAWGLRDSLLVALVLWTMVAQARFRLLPATMVTLVAVQLALYLRPTVAVFLVVALFSRVRLRPTYLLGVSISVAAAVVFLLPRTIALVDLIDTVRLESGPLAFRGGEESTNVVSRPEHLATFLFGPFPWSFDPESSGPDRWQYIGTIVWIASLAFAPAAIRGAWRDRAVGRPIVLASMAYATIYFASFGGAFYRQRSLLQCVLMVLVLAYVPLRASVMARRATIWFGFVGLIALFQAEPLLPSRTAKVAAAGVILIGVASVAWCFRFQRRGSVRTDRMRSSSERQVGVHQSLQRVGHGDRPDRATTDG